MVAAAILAYILNPIIVLLDTKTSLKRGHAMLIVYLLVLVGFVGGMIALGVATVEQVTNLINQVPTLKQYYYAKLPDKVLLVDPMARKVVDVITQ